jgi:hypothetical protein
LIPALGAQGAAELHEKLTRRALNAACASGANEIRLWCDPDPVHPFFEACAREYPVILCKQSGAELGERMHNAFEHALVRYGRALLIGSDIPAIDADYLRGAAGSLDDVPAVFGPAEDGGYVLVGMKQAAREIFRDIEWGSSRVMAQTRERLRQSGWMWAEMPMLWDLDLPEDLVRWQR